MNAENLWIGSIEVVQQVLLEKAQIDGEFVVWRVKNSEDIIIKRDRTVIK